MGSRLNAGFASSGFSASWLQFRAVGVRKVWGLRFQGATALGLGVFGVYVVVKRIRLLKEPDTQNPDRTLKGAPTSLRAGCFKGTPVTPSGVSRGLEFQSLPCRVQVAQGLGFRGLSRVEDLGFRVAPSSFMQ